MEVETRSDSSREIPSSASLVHIFNREIKRQRLCGGRGRGVDVDDHRAAAAAAAEMYALVTLFFPHRILSRPVDCSRRWREKT